MAHVYDLPKFSAITELFKPITWFPPMWAFACGAIAIGANWATHWLLIIIGIVLAGPLVCATSQAVNDWFDRHVDAINEPNRPIPSGRIPGRWGLYLAILWTALSMVVATFLGPLGLLAATVGLVLAWAYSAPPFRLKRNGWYGNAACGFCYEGVAWVTGSAILLQNSSLIELTRAGSPFAHSFTFAILYSVAAHGIMTLNDFKAMKGDMQMGIRSLPVQLGAPRAAQIAAATMLIPQACSVLLLSSMNALHYAATIAVLIVIQVFLLRSFLRNPIEKALWYSGFGVPVLVSGMMVCAFGVRNTI
jgi:chlorophyll/bacteriochlorophyll a synthase